MDTKSLRCSATSNGRPHPLFIEGGPKLAVTLKSRENRVFADCPHHRNLIIRHSKPTARTAMIMCQSRPLEPRADCPHPWGGPSAVQNFEPTDLQTSLTKSGSDRRTVHSPGADRPPLRAGPSAVQFGHPRQNYQVHSKSQPNLRRTPKSLSCFPKLININSNSFSFANVPTPPREQHHVHVC